MFGSVMIARRHRCNRVVMKAAVTLLVVFGFLMAERAWAQFDASNWKWFREVKVGPEVSEGPAGIPLESSILEKCRSDLMDIRLVDSNGQPVPFTISDGLEGEEPEPFPARIFRMARKSGAWTDVWVDMTAKVLTRGVLIQTPTKDFVRRIEVRGSDNGKESYVIRVDGLIADLRQPMAIRNLAVFYPVHNFQYLHIRVLDQDKPPLKIEGVLCYPPAAADALSRPLDARILENRGESATGTTTLVADLGEKRFPMTSLRISSPTREFTNKVTVLAASSASPESWTKLHEGMVFRLAREEGSEEMLRVRFDPSMLRYLKLQLSGKGTAPLVVDRLFVTGTMRLVVFNYLRGREYRLYYDSPQAAPPAADARVTSIRMAQVTDASAKILLGPEQRNTASPKPVQGASRTAVEKSPVGLIAGVLMVLVGLLLLFSLMLKARSRRDSRRPLRSINTRV